MSTINELHLVAARDVVRQLRDELAAAERELREAENAVNVERAVDLGRREAAAQRNEWFK